MPYGRPRRQANRAPGIGSGQLIDGSESETRQPDIQDLLPPVRLRLGICRPGPLPPTTTYSLAGLHRGCMLLSESSPRFSGGCYTMVPLLFQFLPRPSRRTKSQAFTTRYAYFVSSAGTSAHLDKYRRLSDRRLKPPFAGRRARHLVLYLNSVPYRPATPRRKTKTLLHHLEPWDQPHPKADIEFGPHSCADEGYIKPPITET